MDIHKDLKHLGFIHHKKTPSASIIREVVFGMEDGMVSTMGAITGIAVGSHNHFTVILAGLVIISVESISMAVGSYLSNKSERDIDLRKINEEKFELKKYPQEEKMELIGMYVRDGWPKKLATEMAEVASQNKNLFLQEMAYRELKVFPDQISKPLQNGVAMGFSYILGGAIPLLPYLFASSVDKVIPVSVGITLVGLFTLGAITTRYSKRKWWKAGFEMFLLASGAALVGDLVGQGVDRWWLK